MKLGPYELDNIYCGECSAMMSALPDNCIDLTVTSPPYDLVDYDESGNFVTHPKNGLRTYNGYSWDFASVARQLWRVTKPGGVVVWVVGDATVNGSETLTSFSQALHFRRLGFNVETMIYQKDKPPMNDRRYQAAFEFMFIFSKGQVKTFNPILVRKSTNDKRKIKSFHRDRQSGMITGFSKPDEHNRIKDNIWFYVASGGNSASDNLASQHPAIFPEALARDHIISWSNPGEIILDPFMGSGTTAKAAKQLGRHWLGFDISQEYVDLANKRLFQTNPPLFVL